MIEKHQLVQLLALVQLLNPNCTFSILGESNKIVAPNLYQLIKYKFMMETILKP
jgi:hypothetical protein